MSRNSVSNCSWRGRKSERKDGSDLFRLGSARQSALSGSEARCGGVQGCAMPLCSTSSCTILAGLTTRYPPAFAVS